MIMRLSCQNAKGILYFRDLLGGPAVASASDPNLPTSGPALRLENASLFFAAAMKFSTGSNICAVACALFLTGCYEVPVTGRKAMNLVDEKDVTKMSIAMFDGMKSQYRVSRDKDKTAQLKRVGDRLQSSISIWDMPDADWEFVLFEVPNQINAFAMAGGKVGVFTGLFKIAKTDDQLASVIAHEIAHVTAKHIHEKLSRELAVNTVGAVGMLGAGLGGAGMLTTQALSQVYGISTNMRGLAFDRRMEKEADLIGLMYMARAGYDPQEAVNVLEALDAESAGEPAQSSFQSTHPSNPERIVQLLDAMPKALEARKASQLPPPSATLK